MKVLHNVIMAYQWSLFVAGALAAPAIAFFTGDLANTLLSLVVSLLALVALKLEVLAFAR